MACGGTRGQNAAMTAILVAIIGGLLVAYILFLPPAERERLLFSDANPGPGTGVGVAGGQGVITQYGPVLIFKDTPGTLRLLKSPTVEHDIPSATIYTKVQTQEIKRVDSAIVRNGVFAKSDLDIPFNVNQDKRNFLLSFNTVEPGDGTLRVLLNGHVIFERPVQEINPAPIPLPADYLNDGKNDVVIETSDVGLAFWRSNTYKLGNVLVSADVIDTTNAASAQTFAIPKDELDAIDTSSLQFVPECDPKEAGRLFVSLNSRLLPGPNNTTTETPNILYNGLPDCGILFKMDVPKEVLLTQNSLLFTSQGQYVIDRIKLVDYLKQNDYPVYYFNLPKNMYDTLAAGHGQLRVTLTFTDYKTVKTGEMVVNGFVQSFSTQDYVYQAVLDPGVLTPGPNTIQVAPHVDRLDVAELKIELV